MSRTLTRRRSGLYPDLKSFEVAPMARLEPVRLRSVDLATPELTACGEVPGFLVAIWMTPLSSRMVMVCTRRCRECPIVIGKFADGHTLELARPEYLCEWILSRLALRSYEKQPRTYVGVKDGVQPPWRRGDPQGVALQRLSCISGDI